MTNFEIDLRGKIPMTDTKITAADEGLGIALCTKLRELAAVPPTIRSLAQLEHTARLAREILVTNIDPHALKGRGTNLTLTPNMGMVGMLQGQGVQYGDSNSYDIPLPGNPMPSSFSENFGATVLRELGAAKGETENKFSLLESVAAISLAREKGLNDLADKLEGQLIHIVSDESIPQNNTEPKTLPETSTEAAQ